MLSAHILIQPSGKLREKIREELHENLNTREQQLTAIKEWLSKQPHLPSKWEDTCIINFLRGCSYSLEKCKRKLDLYFTMRAACPEFFVDRDINRPELMYLVHRMQGVVMPRLTPDGRRVTIFRALDETTGPEHLNNAIKIALMIGDIRLREEVEGVAGDVYIVDASIISPSNLAKVSSLAIVKRFFICAQEAYPQKFKGIHIFNATTALNILLALFLPFVKEKFKKRIYIHEDVKDLQAHVPLDALPTEYGGCGDSFEDIHNAWFKKLQDYTDWFKEQESIMADESLRPGNAKTYNELFGVEGSFRQLSID